MSEDNEETKAIVSAITALILSTPICRSKRDLCSPRLPSQAI